MYTNFRRKYFIHKFDNGQFVVVKILNEYNTEEEAEEDLFSSVAKEISEKDLLKKFSE